MRSRICLLAATALVLVSVAYPAIQKRVEKKQAKDFPALIATASEAWGSESWRECNSALSEALSLASTKRIESIQAAFPHPGDTWTKKPTKAIDPTTLLMSRFTGLMVEAHFTGPERARMSLQATIDSPLAQMITMQLINPKLGGQDAEVIEYENYKGLLTKKGKNGFQLQILVDTNLITAESNGLSGDDLLAIMSEKAVTRLAAAIAR